jgi:hypothetical protein
MGEMRGAATHTYTYMHTEILRSVLLDGKARIQFAASIVWP